MIDVINSTDTFTILKIVVYFFVINACSYKPSTFKMFEKYMNVIFFLKGFLKILVLKNNGKNRRQNPAEFHLLLKKFFFLKY